MRRVWSLTSCLKLEKQSNLQVNHTVNIMSNLHPSYIRDWWRLRLKSVLGFWLKIGIWEPSNIKCHNVFSSEKKSWFHKHLEPVLSFHCTQKNVHYVIALHWIGRGAYSCLYILVSLYFQILKLGTRHDPHWKMYKLKYEKKKKNFWWLFPFL